MSPKQQQQAVYRVTANFYYRTKSKTAYANWSTVHLNQHSALSAPCDFRNSVFLQRNTNVMRILC